MSEPAMTYQKGGTGCRNFGKVGVVGGHTGGCERGGMGTGRGWLPLAHGTPPQQECQNCNEFGNGWSQGAPGSVCPNQWHCYTQQGMGAAYVMGRAHTPNGPRLNM